MDTEILSGIPHCQVKSISLHQDNVNFDLQWRKITGTLIFFYDGSGSISFPSLSWKSSWSLRSQDYTLPCIIRLFLEEQIRNLERSKEADSDVNLKALKKILCVCDQKVIEDYDGADGTKRVSYPDGTIDTYSAEGMRITREYSNGALEKFHLDGSRSIQYIDGEVDIFYGDTLVSKEYSNGEVEVFYENGSKDIEHLDGSVEKQNTDGSFSQWSASGKLISHTDRDNIEGFFVTNIGTKYTYHRGEFIMVQDHRGRIIQKWNWDHTKGFCLDDEDNIYVYAEDGSFDKINAQGNLLEHWDKENKEGFFIDNKGCKHIYSKEGSFSKFSPSGDLIEKFSCFVDKK